VRTVLKHGLIVVGWLTPFGDGTLSHNVAAGER
jgi:hypothetical protein